MKEWFRSMEALERAIHLYNRVENQTRDFGLGFGLTVREIHAIQFIGEHKGINLKALASSLGVTKGAASQLVSRLVGKEVVDKRRSDENEAEVVLSLTEMGEKAFLAHEEFHKKGLESIDRISEKYSEREWKAFCAILGDLEEAILSMAEEKKNEE